MHILFMAIMEGSNPTTIKWHLKEYDSRGSNEYAKGSSEQEQLTAYNASSTLAIKVTDMDSVRTMIDAAFSAGANMLNGITFSASNTEEAKSES